MRKLFKVTLPAICLLCFLSCSSLVNTTSRFSNFDDLGITKKKFIKKYGDPTTKDLFQDDEKNIIETLYYIEEIDYDLSKSTPIITAFHFKNGVLVKQEKDSVVFNKVVPQKE